MKAILDVIATLYDAKNFYDVGKIIISIMDMVTESSMIGGKIGIYDKEIDEYQIYFSSNVEIPEQEELKNYYEDFKPCKFNEIKYFSRIVAETKKTLVIQDNHSIESIEISPIQKYSAPHSMLWVPLVYDDEFLGIISIGSQPINSFSNEIIETIESIAKITSIRVNQMFALSKLIKSEEKYRLLVESADDAIVLSDLNGKYIYRNAAYYLNLGFDIGEKINDNGFNMIHPDDLANAKKSFQLIYDTGVLTGEYRVKNKQGEWIYHQNKTVLLYNTKHEPEAMLSFIRDVTLQKETEHQLKQYANELKELNSMKDKFLSVISHDLLESILSFKIILESLIAEKSKKTEARKDELLGILFDSMENTYEMLNVLIIWAQSLQNGFSFNPSYYDASELIRYVITPFNSVANKKNINIILDGSHPLEGYFDKNMILVALRNLLSNAIKFSNENGIILICSKKEGNFLEISVKNIGVGIRDEDKGNIFQATKSYTTSGTKGEIGSGVGLILSKEFVEKNGGKIWFESKPGDETTFYFTIPVSSIK